VDLSARWARRCRDAWDAAGRRSAQGHDQALFAIQQGGVHDDLRARSAEALVELDLPGYAIGGLSVGEGHEKLVATLDPLDEQFPAGKPRYLMGVGEPRDILAAVARGVDLFDCVLPTRNGRNAQAFTFAGRIRLRNACHTDDPSPIEDGCECYTCEHFSRGTIRHLFMAREMLGPTLVTIHNLRFFARMMAGIREAIEAGEFGRLCERWLAGMYGDQEPAGGSG
jgi:queuine tRNA-ribosyltransferase